MKPFVFISFAVILAVSACAPNAVPLPADSNPSYPSPSYPNPPEAPTESPVAEEPIPQLPIDGLERGAVFLESTDLLKSESLPLQFTLALNGNLPTPCHELRFNVKPPDAENKIMVEVYSVTSPDVICIQVLQPFEENIPLGSFPAGKYTVWVNGNQVAEFDA